MDDNKLTLEIAVGDLNYNDIRLLYLCKDRERSITDLSKELGIAQKNIIVRLEKLNAKNLIFVNRQGKGKKTLIETNVKNKEFETVLLANQFMDASNKILNSERREEYLKDLKKTHEQVNSKKKK